MTCKKQKMNLLKIVLILLIGFTIINCMCVANEHWWFGGKEEDDSVKQMASIGAMIQDVQEIEEAANRECVEKDGVCHEWKRYPEHDYGVWGTSISGINYIATVESCKDQCVSLPNCRGFSITNNNDQPTCWTKEKGVGTTPDGTPEPNGRSVISKTDLDAYELTPYTVN